MQLDEPPPASATDKTDLGLFRNQLKKLKELPGFGRQPLDDEFFKLNDNFFKGPFGDIFKEFLGKDAPFRSHMFDSFTWPDMGRLMKELNKNDGDISINIDGQKLSYRLERQEGQSSETCTLDVDENGKVVATVKTKDEKGDEVENRYEAENMKAFQENYPEIAEKFDVKNTGIIMSFPGARQHLFNLGKDGANRSLSWSIPQLKTGQRRTLGVYLDPEGPGKVLRAHLGLTDNEGVIIEKVLPGSFASKIDLRPMDIVTAINGQIVGSAENIRDILETVEASDNVEVKIFRNGEKKVLNGTYDFENTKKDAG
ncbi:MAG: PDZ domain-containing protein [Planctomycetota bacterium]